MMKKILLILALLLGLGLLMQPVVAQISIPNTLVAGQTITAAGLNTNFATLGNHALDRISGGNITGNVTAAALVTIDGVDIGAVACTTCSPVFKNLTLTAPTVGLVVAGSVIIDSTGHIGGLTSTYFTSLDTAALTGTIGAINGTNIQSISASHLTTGTVSTPLLGSGAASSSNYLRGDQTWSAIQRSLPTGTKTSGYTAVANDFVVADTTAGSFIITLPAAAANANAIIDVKNIGSAGNTLTVDGNGAETIDGALTFTMTAQYQSVTVICDGTQWWIR